MNPHLISPTPVFGLLDYARGHKVEKADIAKVGYTVTTSILSSSLIINPFLDDVMNLIIDRIDCPNS